MIFACGFKTDPQSKDSFQILTPEAVIVRNTASGISITNPQSSLQLIVERAIRTDKCLSPFQHLQRIPAKQQFVDSDVISGSTYVYRLFYVDPALRITSLSSVKTIIYAKPIVVSSIAVEQLTTSTLKVKPSFTAPPLYYTVFLNNKQIMKTRKSSFEFLLDNQLHNTLKIVPYDNFNNKGTAFTEDVINSSIAKVTAPQNIQSIIGLSNLFLTWDKVDGALSYIIMINGKLHADTQHNSFIYPLPIQPGCIMFSIQSRNLHYQSSAQSLEVCF